MISCVKWHTQFWLQVLTAEAQHNKHIDPGPARCTLPLTADINMRDTSNGRTGVELADLQLYCQDIQPGMTSPASIGP